MARTQIATDAFPYSDGDLVVVGSANWAAMNAVNGTVRVATNKIRGNNGSRIQDRWIGTGTFTDDQYSTLVITGNANSSDRLGVIARATGSASTRTCYMSYLNDLVTRTLTLSKIVNAAETSLGTDTSHTWVDNDTVEIEAQGSTIRALVNGVALITVTDTAIPSGGVPGVVGHGSANLLRGSSWVGGNLTAGGTPPILGQICT